MLVTRDQSFHLNNFYRNGQLTVFSLNTQTISRMKVQRKKEKDNFHLFRRNKLTVKR